MKTIFLGCGMVALLFCSCATHRRANIQVDEEFVVELARPQSRGAVELGLEAIFMGAKYLADNTAKSLATSYKKSISIPDYYNTYLGEVEKSYAEIHIKKYAKPTEDKKEEELKTLLEHDIENQPKLNTRGAASRAFTLKDVVREDKDDLLNFHAVISLISDPENPGVTRLSFDQLCVFFSKTRIFTDENLNAKVSVKIEGQWRSTDGSPQNAVLIQQEYDFKNLKYGSENQIKEPILSPWYYDIPITSEIVDNKEFGLLRVTVQLDEYEGRKSKYINKLPGLLNDNRKSIVHDGASVIEKIMN